MARGKLGELTWIGKSCACPLSLISLTMSSTDIDEAPNWKVSLAGIVKGQRARKIL